MVPVLRLHGSAIRRFSGPEEPWEPACGEPLLIR